MLSSAAWHHIPSLLWPGLWEVRGSQAAEGGFCYKGIQIQGDECSYVLGIGALSTGVSCSGMPEFPATTWATFWDFPSRPSRYSLPSPSPPYNHTLQMSELNCSLRDLHLHPQQWESRSRMQIGGTPMHAAGYPLSLPRPVAECLPFGLVQKQVCFDLADDLGEIPSLPTTWPAF